MILLDTDVCIEIIRGNKNVFAKRVQENDTVGISFLTVAELYYGAYRSKNCEHNINQVEKFLLTIKIIESELIIMQKFGELKAKLKQDDLLLPDADIFIAATAIIKAKKLITGNIDHYKRFNQLEIENWIR